MEIRKLAGSAIFLWGVVFEGRAKNEALEPKSTHLNCTSAAIGILLFQSLVPHCASMPLLHAIRSSASSSQLSSVASKWLSSVASKWSVGSLLFSGDDVLGDSEVYSARDDSG